jgi:sugar lactone lactonase YvrE
MKIERLNVAPDMLGESPVWDAVSEQLFWVDVVSRKVRALHLASGKERAWSTPSYVGSIGLAGEDSLVLALQDGFSRLELASSRIEPIVRLHDADPQMRLNDGKMDRSGRFLCGGMGLKADPRGALHRLSAPRRLERLADGIRISNAISFSPDGSLMYFADSLSHQIMVHDYDPHGVHVGPPRLFLDTTPLKSAPDGATVDAEGHLWVALVQSRQVARVSPAGEVVTTIDLPVDFPSCPAFGGKNMDTLFVTSIKDSGTGRMVSSHENAGSVFVISGLGVRGIPETRFNAGV